MRRYISIFLVVVTLSVSTLLPAVRVRAAGLPAAVYTTWEILQWILLSAGVTVTGLELTEDAFGVTADSVVDAVCSSINDYAHGVGDAIKDAVTVASVSGLMAVTFARETWSDLVGWARSLFAESPAAVLRVNGSLSVDFNSVDDVVDIIAYLTGFRFPSDSGGYEDLSEFLRKASFYSAPISAWLISWDESKYIRPWRYYLYLVYDPNHQSVIIPSLYDTQVSRGAATYYVTTGVNCDYMCFGGSRYGDAMVPYTGTYTANYRISSNVNTAVTFQTPLIGSEFKVKSEATAQIDPGFRSEVLEDDLVIVTPGTQLRDGELVGDVTLPIPGDLADVLDDVLTGTKSIPDALEDVDVYPIPATDEDAIADALNQVGAVDPAVPAIPDTGTYGVSLKEFFPFCIPFDVIDLLGVLAAEPEAPTVTFKLPVGYDGKEVLWQEYTISLEMFDPVAVVVRRFELLAFIVGLAVATRSMFIRS